MSTLIAAHLRIAPLTAAATVDPMALRHLLYAQCGPGNGWSTSECAPDHTAPTSSLSSTAMTRKKQMNLFDRSSKRRLPPLRRLLLAGGLAHRTISPIDPSSIRTRERWKNMLIRRITALTLGVTLAAGLGLAAGVGATVAGAPQAAHAASSVGGQISRDEIMSRAQYWYDNRGNIPYSERLVPRPGR
ncbi:hypothetical protein V2I01_18860 [Micromonospora sp. BRA006-A]|nr:hypothetical protein [Micromonospora sp. BRA006-A]